MSLPTPKELKRLAAACRKAGITHFKQGDLEITVSEEAPAQTKRSGRSVHAVSQQADVESKDGWDDLTDEEKLFFSVVGEANDILESPVK